jgi:sec-independent protein translocase protein TatC
MEQQKDAELGTFWDHLDVLRGTLVRIAIVIVAVGCVAFCFKDQLFAIVLAPKDSDFITYRILNRLVGVSPLLGSGVEHFTIRLINTQLAQQFTIHIQMAMYAGFMLALPYVIYEIFRFVSPALYTNERKYAFRLVTSGYVMFMIGVAVAYFLVFPLTFRFLGTYQVSGDVENEIVLDSYIDTMLMLNLMMGIVFELPVLCWLLSKFGFISASFLRRYRRHAVVILLVIAAVITPTSDAFTLFAVSLPMYLLYEASIAIVMISQKKSTGEVES